MVKSSELQYLTVDDQEDEYQDVVESDAFAIHMNAMTAEHLHSKSEIAVELARRDMKVDSLERERDALQARIDALMLEYCQDEMTPEQIQTWENNQKVSLQEVKPNER